VASHHVVNSDFACLVSHINYLQTSRKIQSVFALSDGSGLAVTVARYETPAHTDIDKVSNCIELSQQISATDGLNLKLLFVGTRLV
jgi:hypothetical protein